MTLFQKPSNRRSLRALPALWLAAASLMGVLLMGRALAAQTAAPKEEKPKEKKPAKVENWRPHFILVPDFYYRPETRLALGAGGFANYRFGKDKAHTRPSTLGLTFVYTMNNQMRLSLRPEVYLPGNAFILNAVLAYSIFPTRFYGIGNNIPESAAETYTPKTYAAQFSVKHKIFKDIFAGLQYQFKRTIIQKVEVGGQLATGTITGSRGGVVSGLGLILTWDNRDNIIFPRRGSFFQLTTDVCGRYLGGDFNYSAFRLDLRRYVPVLGRDVLAFQLLVRTVGGNAPFYDLSNLGGAWMMRGTFNGRYSDKSLLAFQTEYRLHVWKRISAVAFAGAGDVASRLTGFTFNPFKYSFGGGLRFRIDSREGTNVRIDYAWGRGSTGLYVTLLEAF
jgi:outer membrane protein assembly factor BamA